MSRKLRMKCSKCGCWNRVPVNKIFIEHPSSEPKVKVLIPMYEPLEVVKCKKCRKVIAEPKELIRIIRSTVVRYLGLQSSRIQSKFLPQVIKTEVADTNNCLF